MLPELPTTLQLVNSDLGHLPDHSLPTKNQLIQPPDDRFWHCRLRQQRKESHELILTRLPAWSCVCNNHHDFLVVTNHLPIA
jgi:hypothetical protein